MSGIKKKFCLTKGCDNIAGADMGQVLKQHQIAELHSGWDYGIWSIVKTRKKQDGISSKHLPALLFSRFTASSSLLEALNYIPEKNVIALLAFSNVLANLRQENV